ncbi:hypothetical protein A0H81_05704 [Grifola frondosa]|uniref:Uncharacterized protein n=1 Tax=Grifola frondosa TaxID=5627 RepID=A0A1C7MI55_GRIFR|nr:hypothetical protein A0H81_05704 [Grifola frondosa]
MRSITALCDMYRPCSRLAVQHVPPSALERLEPVQVRELRLLLDELGDDVTSEVLLETQERERIVVGEF